MTYGYVAIAADGAGGALIMGELSAGSSYPVTIGGTAFTQNGLFVMRLTSAGAVDWVNTPTSTASSSSGPWPVGRDVAPDGAGMPAPLEPATSRVRPAACHCQPNRIDLARAASSLSVLHVAADSHGLRLGRCCTGGALVTGDFMWATTTEHSTGTPVVTARQATFGAVTITGELVDDTDSDVGRRALEP